MVTEFFIYSIDLDRQFLKIWPSLYINRSIQSICKKLEERINELLEEFFTSGIVQCMVFEQSKYNVLQCIQANDLLRLCLLIIINELHGFVG